MLKSLDGIITVLSLLSAIVSAIGLIFMLIDDNREGFLNKCGWLMLVFGAISGLFVLILIYVFE